jgi:hypothetical protein
MVRVIFKIVTSWVGFSSDELSFSLQERVPFLGVWFLCCPPEFYAFSLMRSNHPLGLFPVAIFSHEFGVWGTLSSI